MVAALDLGSNVERRGGSSPFIRTKRKTDVIVGFFCPQIDTEINLLNLRKFVDKIYVIRDVISY